MSSHETKTAKLYWNEQGYPVSNQFNDVYFSTADGLQETQHVFLSGNNLPQRWLSDNSHLSPAKKTSYQPFTIGETGFGSGLNFLATWDKWDKLNAPSDYTQLHFISVEKYPLSLSDLKKALALWPELAHLTQQLMTQYPPQPAYGTHRLYFNSPRTGFHSVCLTLYFGDACEGFESMAASAPSSTLKNISFGPHRPTVDAWFLDGFSPSLNPQMWSTELFLAIANMSDKQTTLSTYTVAGFVKRGLESVGFVGEKTPGFGQKKQMLSALFTPPIKNDNLHTPELTTKNPKVDGEQNHKPSQRQHKPAPPGRQNHASKNAWHAQSLQHTKNDSRHKTPHVLVIGGGLSGCHTAHALSKKGCKVTLIEKNSALAREGSGNRQAVVYTRLSPIKNPLSDFNFAAQVFADNFYASLNLFSQCGEPSGVMHLAMNKKQQNHYQELCALYANNPEYFDWVNIDKMKEKTGLAFNNPGMYLGHSGWLAPRLLCETLIRSSAHVCTLLNTALSRLHYDQNDTQDDIDNNNQDKNYDNTQGQWHAYDTNNKKILSASHVVICTAYDALSLEQTHGFPLKAIRGQVTHLPASSSTTPLKMAVCADGYISPAAQIDDDETPTHSLGASFNLHNNSHQLSTQDHQDNLKKLHASAHLPHQATDTYNLKQLDGKVGFRCTTPDYFPIAGPVPQWSQMASDFCALRKNANKYIPKPGTFQSNLYCNIGLGSRGLAYAPLTADIISSLITSSSLPVSSTMYQHLHPARFLIRNLQRNVS